MKFKTFRAIAVAGAVALGGGGIYLAARGGDDRADEAPAATRAQDLAAPAPPVEPTPRPLSMPPASATAGVPLRPMDQEILARARRGISGDKAKDAVPGKAYKVNLYRDAGKPGVNRLKVDLDRDDRWDEKWSLDVDGTVKRQVSAADDDRTYGDEYTLRGDRWLTAADEAAARSAPPEAAPAPPEAAPAATSDSVPLRPMDEELLRLAATPATSAKIKDAFPGQPYKVNLYRDAGKAGWNRAKVDLDRDEKDDEKWTFERDGAALEVKRQVATADDEQYGLEYRLRGGKWVEKK